MSTLPGMRFWKSAWTTDKRMQHRKPSPLSSPSRLPLTRTVPVVGAMGVAAKAEAKEVGKGREAISSLLRRGRPREFAYAIAFEGCVTNRSAVRIRLKQRCILPHVSATVSCLLSARSGLRAREKRHVTLASDVSRNMGMDRSNLHQNTEVGLCRAPWLTFPNLKSPQCHRGRVRASQPLRARA